MAVEPAFPPGLGRPAELAIALVLAVVTMPIVAVAGVAVLVTSGRPIFFRQQRVGRGGVPFELLKLRTMRSGVAGTAVTAKGDPRVTAVGRLLRRLRLDELPQLWNVVRGELALVGPRPEVPRFVDRDDPEWQRILAARPGVTDPVTLGLLDEEALLASAPDPERYYRDELLPKKKAAAIAYLERRSAASDLGVLWRTALALGGGGGGR